MTDRGDERDFHNVEDRDLTDGVLTTGDELDFEDEESDDSSAQSNSAESDEDERVMVIGEDEDTYLASDCWILRVQEDFGNSTNEVQRTNTYYS